MTESPYDRWKTHNPFDADRGREREVCASPHCENDADDVSAWCESCWDEGIPECHCGAPAVTVDADGNPACDDHFDEERE